MLPSITALRRLCSRFEFSPKLVNPNNAAELVVKQAPIVSDQHVVSCDGGHPVTGHPKIYINLVSLRFRNK
jgi:uncharacterized Zn-finger protein